MSQLQKNFGRNAAGKFSPYRRKSGLLSLLVGGYLIYVIFKFFFGDWIYSHSAYVIFLVVTASVYLAYQVVRRIRARQMDWEFLRSLLMALTVLYLIYSLAAEGQARQQLKDSLVGAYRSIDGRELLNIVDHETLRVDFADGSQLRANYTTSSESGQSLYLVFDGELTTARGNHTKPYQERLTASLVNDTLTFNRDDQSHSVYIRQ